jgi:hypothetical protein
MLTMTVVSDTIPQELQAAQAIASAAAEMWQYGRAVFEENVAKLRSIINECKLHPYVTKTTILTWEGYLGRHQQVSLGMNDLLPDTE